MRRLGFAGGVARSSVRYASVAVPQEPLRQPRWTPKSGHQWTPENRPPQAS